MRLRSRFLGLAGLFVLTVGCQSPLASLPSEDQHPELTVLKAQAAEMQRRTFYVQVEVAPGHVIQLAVHETGAFGHGRTLVLVHGVMSDSKIWRFVDAQWAKDYRVLAIDLPGCGESDKPDPSSLPPDAYGPESLARCVLAAARGRLGEADEPVTLIGHSLGGLIILRMFGDPQIRRDYNDVLARVDRLALFSPAHVAIEREPDVFHEIEHTDEFSFELAAVAGLLERRIAQSMRQSVSEPALALREEARRLSAILGNRQTRRAVRGMLRSALPRVGRSSELGPNAAAVGRLCSGERALRDRLGRGG
jgi:pimeloyl-ACP methyl ester carboxylesterase